MGPCRWTLWPGTWGFSGPVPGKHHLAAASSRPQVSSSAHFQIQLSGGGQRWPLPPQRPLPTAPHWGRWAAPPGSSPWALDQNLECQRWPGPLGTPPWPCCGAARVSKAWRRDPRSAAGGMSRPVHPWEPSAQVEVKAQRAIRGGRGTPRPPQPLPRSPESHSARRGATLRQPSSH